LFFFSSILFKLNKQTNK